MKLLTKEIARQIPRLYTTENEPDPLVVCKFFTPWSHWTWYVVEYDGEDLFFGWVDGDFPEMGYFSRSELEGVRGPFGLTIERDLYFTPCRLSEVRKKHGH
jgi:hypothetical protein